MILDHLQLCRTSTEENIFDAVLNVSIAPLPAGGPEKSADAF